jgi:hypothetical protein
MKKILTQLRNFVLRIFVSNDRVQLEYPAISPTRRWTKDEEVVACYCLMHKVEYLDMTIEKLADAIDRTPGALRIKMSRLTHADMLSSEAIMLMIKLNEFAACKELLKALIRISDKLQNGRADVFRMRLIKETQY